MVKNQSPLPGPEYSKTTIKKTLANLTYGAIYINEKTKI